MKGKVYLVLIGIVACLLLRVPAFSQSSVSLDRHREFGRRGSHGRRPRKSQAGRRQHHHHGGQRRPRTTMPFPPAKFKPGQYALSVSATGYEVPNRSITVTVGSGNDESRSEARTRFRLPSWSISLTPAEIMNSLPGTPNKFDSVAECGVCHSMSRILKSTHDAEEFKAVILRMRNHTPIGQRHPSRKSSLSHVAAAKGRGPGKLIWPP